MLLPVIDVGLMDEHLTAHEGVIPKLKKYKSMVNHPQLKEIIDLHISVLQHHVVVMLQLLDPNRKQWVYLKSLPLPTTKHSGDHKMEWKKSTDKSIALEAMSTAKNMGSTNFNSALMMKDPNVKHIHFEMAIQDAILQGKYNDFMKSMNSDHPPMATSEIQQYTIQKHQHILK